MTRPKFPNACSARGASMGRSDSIMEPQEAIKFRLYKMPMVDHDYDTGGAYWGGDSKHAVMYHAYGDGPKWKNEVFVRARDREEAKRLVRQTFKNAKFYR